jgi:hypothetical protein
MARASRVSSDKKESDSRPACALMKNSLMDHCFANPFLHGWFSAEPLPQWVILDYIAMQQSGRFETNPPTNKFRIQHWRVP